MSPELLVRAAGPQVTVQDLGRPGHLSSGLSRGGAADRLALLEAAALLELPLGSAALEMAGIGGEYEVSADVRVALTGAPMRAEIAGRRLSWNATHRLKPGDTLRIGAAEAGTYGYLSLAGGIETPCLMGSRSAHLAARIGARLRDRDRIPLGHDPKPDAELKVLEPDARFGGGLVRVVPGGQTAMFSVGQRERFEATAFTRDPRGNRQGVRLAFDGAPFGAEGGRSVLSEIILPGDIQMTGDGTPYVLLPECQTIGGYPRIGTVFPADLPRIAQAAPGAHVRFRFMSFEEARAEYRDEAHQLAGLLRGVRGRLRDPRDIPDLLGYHLISGATDGLEEGPI
ncbi:MAG: urea amidolyase [Pseudomonadota bacterium]